MPLRPNDLNLMGINSGPLNTLGIVHLSIYLGKETSIIRLNFYVASNFSLPTDWLLVLMSRKSNNMGIHPDGIMIRCQNKSVKAIVQSMCLAYGWEINCYARLFMIYWFRIISFVVVRVCFGVVLTIMNYN